MTHHYYCHFKYFDFSFFLELKKLLGDVNLKYIDYYFKNQYIRENTYFKDYINKGLIVKNQIFLIQYKKQVAEIDSLLTHGWGHFN